MNMGKVWSSRIVMAWLVNGANEQQEYVLQLDLLSSVKAYLTPPPPSSSPRVSSKAFRSVLIARFEI